MRKHLSLIIFLVVLGGVALAQATLGNMFKLGTTTTAARPASSATIQGALLYDTDVGQPIYNTGAAWSTFGGGSSDPSLWRDAGSGFITPHGTTTGLDLNAVVDIDVTTGTNAMSLATNGSRLDLGTGSTDYFYSDGVGLHTPASLEVVDYLRVVDDGVVFDPTGLPTSAQSEMHIASSPRWAGEATTGSIFVHDGNNWQALGMGKNYGVQKKAMFVETAIERTAAHTMRLPVLNSSGTDISWVCSDTGTATSSFVNDRPYRNSTTGTTASNIAYCHTGSVAGTMQFVTQARAKPALCAWVSTPYDTSIRLWFGLTNTDPSNLSTSDLSAYDFAGIRYDTSASDSVWHAISCNAANCTVQPTSLGVSSGRTYRVCVDLAGDNTDVNFFISEYGGGTASSEIHYNATYVPTSTTWLGVVFYVETLDNATAAFGLSNLSLETN